jgi:hypothetical protein
MIEIHAQFLSHYLSGQPGRQSYYFISPPLVYIG